MSQMFANTPDDCTWLLDTHLSAQYVEDAVPPFASYILYGNEDCPDRLELFADADPLYTDRPIAVFIYNPDNGKYRKDG